MPDRPTPEPWVDPHPGRTCELINDDLSIHFWTGPNADAPCKCGEKVRSRG